ncbi:hypothetical protein J6Q66_00895 [bacterium]|nr:hypothetical protein [bacterium]
MASVGQITGQIASTNSFGQLTFKRMGSRAGAATYANIPDELFQKPPKPTDGQKDFTAAWLGD